MRCLIPMVLAVSASAQEACPDPSLDAWRRTLTTDERVRLYDAAAARLGTLAPVPAGRRGLSDAEKSHWVDFVFRTLVAVMNQMRGGS